MISLVRRRISFRKWLGSLNQTLEWNIFKEKLHHEVVSWHRHPFKHLWPQIHPATHDMVSLTLAYKNYVSVSFLFFKVCTDCLIYCDINSKLLSNRNHGIKKPTELSQFLLFILFYFSWYSFIGTEISPSIPLCSLLTIFLHIITHSPTLLHSFNSSHKSIILLFKCINIVNINSGRKSRVLLSRYI